jgi:murein DD-endopeptidase MepM/ murein hydrolase activator NlpD
VTRPLTTSLLAALSALCFVIACSGTDGDDPPAAPETAANPEGGDESEEDGGVEELFVEHTIEPGDTLSGISRAYGVSLSDIMEANEMSRRDARRLSVGQVLRIPGVTGTLEEMNAQNDEGDAGVSGDGGAESESDVPDAGPQNLLGEDGGVPGAYHTLSEGETLWDLANVYDLSVDDILEANGFDDDAVRGLRPGQQILIPGIKVGQLRTVARPEGRGLWHTVEANESIWDIARQYRVGASEVMSANGILRQDIGNLREGRRVFIPGRGPARGSSRAPRERPITAAQRRALGRARLLGLGVERAGHKLLGGVVEPRWVRAVGGNRDRFPGTLRWPVTNGRFVRGYGSGEGGYHLAVDIAGDIGWNVRAAAAGIVGYSGDGIRGYGNIVLVIHQGGWVTLYAHNSVNFVVAGERVRAGGILAEVGSTGISRGPHVHFEFMYDGQNCDPAELFRPGLRYSGTRSRRSNTTWLLPNQKPESIRCARRRRHPRSRWVMNEDPGRDGE